MYAGSQPDGMLHVRSWASKGIAREDKVLEVETVTGRNAVWAIAD